MATKIQLRRDTLENWMRVNPVLMEGEEVLIALDSSKPTDYNGKKVGDGVRTFTQLPVLGYECLQVLGDSTLYPVSQKVLTEQLKNKMNSANIVTMSEGDYAALEEKNEETYYFIFEEEL